jgi:hypothetical protein
MSLTTRYKKKALMSTPMTNCQRFMTNYSTIEGSNKKTPDGLKNDAWVWKFKDSIPVKIFIDTAYTYLFVLRGDFEEVR